MVSAFRIGSPRFVGSRYTGAGPFHLSIVRDKFQNCTTVIHTCLYRVQREPTKESNPRKCRTSSQYSYASPMRRCRNNCGHTIRDTRIHNRILQYGINGCWQNVAQTTHRFVYPSTWVIQSTRTANNLPSIMYRKQKSGCASAACGTVENQTCITTGISQYIPYQYCSIHSEKTLKTNARMCSAPQAGRRGGTVRCHGSGSPGTLG